MKNLTIIILTTILFLSCIDNERTEKLETEIEVLKRQYDSLENIANGIKDKYVFDSLTIRQIPYYANSSKLNSIYKEEFVLVGYNTNGKTSVIIGDSTYFDNGLKVFNGDTLISKKGAFQNEIKLTQDRTYYGGIIRTENEYGKSFERTFKAVVQTKN